MMKWLFGKWLFGISVRVSIGVSLAYWSTGQTLKAQALPQAANLNDSHPLSIKALSLESLPSETLISDIPTSAILALDVLALEILLSDASAESLDLEPTVLENSPILQRWLEKVPDVLSDIENDPSFRPRIRAGYSQDWSDQNGRFIIGVEDIFLGDSGLTVSGDYQGTWNEDDSQYGLDLRYYLLPLGKNVNLATVLGYRHVNAGDGVSTLDGANVGIRLLFVPARTGAVDVSLTQTWVAPESDRTLSRFTLSAGYALNPNLRLSTDLQVQTSEQDSQTNVGLLLEWLL
ncbi:MAG: hypothetical protein AAGD25_26490 [Cyanobacteria bacterium P01_F01_bin.150]